MDLLKIIQKMDDMSNGSTGRLDKLDVVEAVSAFANQIGIMELFAYDDFSEDERYEIQEIFEWIEIKKRKASFKDVAKHLSFETLEYCDR